MQTTNSSAALVPDASDSSELLGRLATLAYGGLVYALFLGTFLAMIAFVSGVVLPKHMASGVAVPVAEALLVNGGILALFAVQHAIMARPAFKRRWTRVIPAAAERSTFVLATCLILILLMWQWRPLPQTVWQVEGVFQGVLWAASAAGFGIVLVSTFLIDHFALFGLKQVVARFRGVPMKQTPFVERGFYRHVRHPLMTGFLIAFWCTPHMTLGHLVFALLCTGYIALGLLLEERDLIAAHGDDYRDYKRRVPSILPFPRRARA